MPDLPVFSDRGYETEILQSDLPVMVYVSTRWCRPGRDLKPVIEQAAEETGGKLKVGTLDADTEPGFVRAHKIRSLPTVVFIKGGKPGGSVTGPFTKLQLMTRISAMLVDEKPAPK